MYVGVIFDEKTNMVADYAPEATMMEYTICDVGYKPNGTKWLPNAYISMHFVEEMGKEEKYHQRIAALICGAIGDGAARALEDYGVKIFRNVTGDVESVFEDYKNNKLEEGENTKLPPRQNLFEYWRAQQRFEKLNPIYYAKGLEMFGSSLSEKDKSWLYDQCFAEKSRWEMLPYIAGAMDHKLDLKRAEKYMNTFLKVWNTILGRNSDNYRDQNEMLDRMKILVGIVQDDCKQEFLDEALILTAKNRLILVAEYLMDQKADINYVNKKGLSVEQYENAMQDLTMQAYLSYYRQHGVKKGSSLIYFICKEKKSIQELFDEDENNKRRIDGGGYFYVPKYADEDGQVFGKRALAVCKDILKDYGKSGLLKNSAKAKDLDEFIEEYNWDDGFEVPHFIAVHPNCSQETKEKMYDLVEGSSYYGTKDFEISDDEQWKTFITELHDMLNGKE